MRLRQKPNRRDTSRGTNTKPSTKRVRFVWTRSSATFAAALLISAFLWLATALNEPSNSTVEVVFPLRYANLTSEYAFEKDPPKEVRVQLSATGITLLRYSLYPVRDTITHFVTEQDIRRRNFEVPESLMLERIRDQLGGSTPIDRVSPSSISIPFYRRSSKSIPIRHNIYADVRSGYLSHPIVIEPKMVVAYGAKSTLNEIVAIETDSLTLSDLHNTTKGKVVLKAPSGVLLSQDSALYSIDVEVLTEMTFQLAIKAINLPEGKRLRPLPATVEVTITIPSSLYNHFESKDIQPVVDYNDVRQKTDHKQDDLLDVELLRLPEEISRYKITPSRVQYILEE